MSVPEIISSYRKANKGLKKSFLVSKYFSLMNAIFEEKKRHNYISMVNLCLQSLQYIEPFINEEVHEYEKFEIKSIPAFELGSLYCALIPGYLGQLKNIKTFIEYFPELKPWETIVLEAYEFGELANKIETVITTNKNCLQKDLKKLLNNKNGKFIERTVHYMENVGRIRREKKGDNICLCPTNQM